MLAVPVLLQPCSAITHSVPTAVPAQLRRPISGQAVPSRGCISQGEQVLLQDDDDTQELRTLSIPPVQHRRVWRRPAPANTPDIVKGTPRCPGTAQLTSSHFSADHTLHAAQRRSHAVYSTGLRITPLWLLPASAFPDRCANAILDPSPLSQLAPAHPPAPQHPLQSCHGAFLTSKLPAQSQCGPLAKRRQGWWWG